MTAESEKRVELPDIPAQLTEPLPVDEALKVVGFRPHPSRDGCVASFGCVGYFAVKSMFDWRLLMTGVRRLPGEGPPREMVCPSDRHLPDRISVVELMAMIYPQWADAHRGETPTDVFLIWGKTWLDYKKEVNALIPPLPSVQVDRQMLRACLKRIAETYDWAEEDYGMEFSLKGGQLCIRARELELHAPASGDWLRRFVMSARVLARQLPRRFLFNVVTIQDRGTVIAFDGREVSFRGISDDEQSDESGEIRPPA